MVITHAQSNYVRPTTSVALFQPFTFCYSLPSILEVATIPWLHFLTIVHTGSFDTETFLYDVSGDIFFFFTSSPLSEISDFFLFACNWDVCKFLKNPAFYFYFFIFRIPRDNTSAIFIS